MQVKRTLSVALFLTVLLLGQAMTGHLNQIPGIEQDSTLESTSVVMASNSTNDTDGDGIDDAYDSCPNGNTNWSSTATTDWDADGCQDSMEDTDDDNDGVSDNYDSCPKGLLGWTSYSGNDYDSDGCKDSNEDYDDDNDWVFDADDSCPKGELGWTSTNSTDADSDGCRDSTEDSDGGAGSGNNTGGNNTGGNNTGGNNSGGNNSGGNNTGGNNTGGNNSGGNNSGGNNSGSNNDSHCLTVDNVSVDTTYVATLDLVNICNHVLNYPGVNASANHPGVSGFYNGTEWYYLIGSYGTYNMSWQLSFDQSVVNGSYITLYFEATILNCGGSDSYHDCPNSNDSTLTHQFLFISNNENSGNNTGGNNTGGNNTGGNNTDGNNTDGNNNGGNNTDGNNNGGNNNGGNNNGGNNTGGNQTTPAIPCSNSSTLTFTNTSNAFEINNAITFTVLVQCGIEETDFILRGDISKYYGLQSWNYNTIEYFQYNSSGQNTPYEMTFTFYISNVTSNSSGDYIIQAYIGDASNIISWISWNFTVYGDNDADGVSDATDNCPSMVNANQTDNDGDGLGDACDSDLDGDGVNNQNDALPNNGNETIDTDNDGLGDNTDDDDDGDGMDDSNDAFPTDPTEQSDLDGDGVGDNLDADDDADGISDTNDNCPLIANADQADLDGDGVGTACDGIELSVDENGTISGDGNVIPSIGMVGTVVAISAGFFIAIRREDEE
jgi:hypothetical protein